jgi:hypothetical protein
MKSNTNPKKSYTIKWKLTLPKNAAILLFLGYGRVQKKDVTTGNHATGQNPIKDIPYSKEFKSVKEIIIPSDIIPEGISCH